LVVLAMIATIGDVMPVWYENRKLIKYGLQILNTSNYTTIKALLLPKSEYDEYDIAFQVVPKVNAVGRLEDSNPNNLVKYFLLKDDRAILKVATQIIQINNKRKELSQQMVIKGLQDIKEDAIHILYDTSFHQGICGLAAGNIASKINRPTLVLSQKDTILKGSGRSIKGFHLYDYLSQYKELFQSFGGHSQAVGLSLSLKDLETLKSNIEKDEIVFTPMIEDVYLIKHITIDDVKQLQHFRPFGEGFMLPKWAFEVKHIPYTMVKEMYPKWQIQEEVSAICFKDLKILDSTEYVIGAIQLNRYFNKESLQIIVQDIM
ncbi:MAG: DHHA1 domain-containing protein, partial [Erysipelotrichaceae bacterium]|nr:DHHA1 domain-containing protein [Erysipelotrichaceae bacterium]